MKLKGWMMPLRLDVPADLEELDAEDDSTEEPSAAVARHIEEGYRQAERGELIPGAQAREEILAMKREWLRSRRIE